MLSQFREKTQCQIKRDNSLTTVWTDRFWLPRVKEDIDELAYALWEVRLQKNPVSLPGEEEWVKLRDVKYGEEKTEVGKE